MSLRISSYHHKFLPAVRTLKCSSVRSGHHEDDPNMERHSADYRPGSGSYDYDNPWPKLNKGKLDWLFGDGWRRPPTAAQGQKMRKGWIPFGYDSHDEYKDWYQWHNYMFGATMCMITMPLWMIFIRSDWPQARDWARREAYLEIARRQAMGLPLISADLLPRERVEAALPSEDELKNFEVLI